MNKLDFVLLLEVLSFLSFCAIMGVGALLNLDGKTVILAAVLTMCLTMMLSLFLRMKWKIPITRW